MRKKLIYKFAMVCMIVFHVVHCEAQSSFQYKSALSDIKSAGFYKIVLRPTIVAKTRNELNDLRILNEKGSQVPYILKSDKPVFQERNFIEFPILKIKKEADKQTHITIHNSTGKTVNELLLMIKNNDAERNITLSGSDDQTQWFIIKEHIPLSNVLAQAQDRFIQSINFPNSSYQFFNLTINGKDLLPVNIVKVGAYEGVLRSGEFESIPEPSIIQKDSSDKLSYVELTFNDNYLINKLQLNVQGPKFFRRDLRINRENDYSFNEYVLSSGTDLSYAINIKAKKVKLIIENQDNPPVRIQSVKAYQLNKYLLAYLEPANKYELVFGDSLAIAPKYDLEFFKDSLSSTASEINTGSIINIAPEKNKQKQAGKTNMLMLWVIIIVVLVLLLFLTIRMTKDIEKNDEVKV